MSLPKWSYDFDYLPSIQELKDINEFGDGNKYDFIEHNPHGTPFQILNKEFIQSLGNEILKIVNKISNDNISILEVGAGNGRLTYFLEKELTIEKVKKNINQIATDDYSWDTLDHPSIRIKKINGINVEKKNIEDSIKKYNPEIIISSWMPYESDWTKIFRENLNTNFFILIGNPEECGTNQSWKDCEKFKSEELQIKGNISWQDQIYKWGDNQSYSKIILFKRK